MILARVAVDGLQDHYMYIELSEASFAREVRLGRWSLPFSDSLERGTNPWNYKIEYERLWTHCVLSAFSIAEKGKRAFAHVFCKMRYAPVHRPERIMEPVEPSSDIPLA